VLRLTTPHPATAPHPQPANVFIDASLNAKLGDVGLAAAAREWFQV